MLYSCMYVYVCHMSCMYNVCMYVVCMYVTYVDYVNDLDS
jgi:hypothetical protein